MKFKAELMTRLKGAFVERWPPWSFLPKGRVADWPSCPQVASAVAACRGSLGVLHVTASFRRIKRNALFTVCHRQLEYFREEKSHNSEN